MTVVRRLPLALFIFVMTGAPSSAALITLEYNFTASGFGAGAPYDPVLGSFSLTFDNATDIFNETAGLNLLGPTLILGSVPGFTYFQASDFLEIGGLENGVDGLAAAPASDDFYLDIGTVSTNPTFLALVYTQTSSPGVYFASERGALTPVDDVFIPEPASLTLLGLGLAGIGARRWRGRKVT